MKHFFLMNDSNSPLDIAEPFKPHYRGRVAQLESANGYNNYSQLFIYDCNNYSTVNTF